MDAVLLESGDIRQADPPSEFVAYFLFVDVGDMRFSFPFSSDPMVGVRSNKAALFVTKRKLSSSSSIFSTVGLQLKLPNL